MEKTADKSLPADVAGLHIHFVGIKGTGMAALVEILHARGAVITGSDVSERFYTDEVLEKLGLSALPFGAANITDDTAFVVYSSAYSPEKNPDLQEAARRGIPMLLYTEALGSVSRMAYSAGVCGVHGKTTTTGLCGTLLKALDLPSQVLAGSIIARFGADGSGSCTMTSPTFYAAEKGARHFFVAETCEYQRHFMAFSPQKIILTSVESDHQDYYPTYEDIREAFIDYLCKLPQGGEVFYCADDKGACETVALACEKRPDIRAVPYGTSAAASGWRISFGAVEAGEQHFTVTVGGEDECMSGEYALSVPGEHNVRNAVAALALVTSLLRVAGRNPANYAAVLKDALKRFAGGKRRSEVIARTKTPLGEGLTVLDDYGHHPTAIATTLSGYRAFYKHHKIIVDFMSHTYTRTAALLEEFASSFGDADLVIINRIYGSAREDASAAGVTGEMLAERTRAHNPHTVYAADFDEAAAVVLSELSKPSGEADGYLLVTMGAGDNWKVGKKVLEALAAQGAAGAGNAAVSVNAAASADVRWKQRFANYQKALSRLSAAVSLSETRALSELEIIGLIKAFEFTFELSWNVMKDYLTEQGITGIIGSKGAIRQAFGASLVSDGEAWMQMISDRNLASHTYDEETARALYEAVRTRYLALFAAFERTMQALAAQGAVGARA